MYAPTVYAIKMRTYKVRTSCWPTQYFLSALQNLTVLRDISGWVIRHTISQLSVMKQIGIIARVKIPMISALDYNSRKVCLPVWKYKPG